jgi:hypothetical protein
LLISNVCQPGLASCQVPPHWLLLMVISLAGWLPLPPELQAVRLAASAALAAVSYAATRRGLVPMVTNDRHRLGGDVRRRRC